ncbi:MAG: 1,4-beta-xylanase, partial [Bacteroidales bacterium]|nr:1,4-beta-xylanase [Bacteroidales bacterium]
MKKLFLTIIAVVPFLASCCSGIDADGKWTAEKANAWYEATGWRSGCNYIPATAINQIEMWQTSTFDPETIDRELGYAEELGFNTMRVFLSSVVYENEPEAFKGHISDFLDIANAHGITPFLVF